MKPLVAIIAPGNMGAAIGRQLRTHGLEVLTSLAGRSAASRARAIEAGLRDVPHRELMRCDLLLSIVPPGVALELAGEIAGWSAPSAHRPLFIDCNAVSPHTACAIAARVQAAGFEFIDAGIIGAPPRTGAMGPSIYVSGAQARRAEVLNDFGLRIRNLDAPAGAASALKLSYAGITKGLTAIASSMILAARRAGVDAALYRELAESQQTLLDGFRRAIPAMYPKAYRWVAEMQEIAAFSASDPAAGAIYSGAAQLYERLARDIETGGLETGELTSFLEQPQEDLSPAPIVVPTRQP